MARLRPSARIEGRRVNGVIPHARSAPVLPKQEPGSLSSLLIQLAESESIAQVAELSISTLSQYVGRSTLFVRFPTHCSIFSLHAGGSSVTMTTIQQIVPMLTPGVCVLSELPKAIQDVISSQTDFLNSDSEKQVITRTDSDSISVSFLIERKQNCDHATDLIHRAALARLSSLFALETARQETYTDDLTGLANRRYFVRRLAEEVDRAQRHGRQLALIILDLDHLKQLNDSLGHQTGDEALREIAIRLRQSVRRIDTVCRYAGDEFCVIMPDAGSETCHALLRRLHSSLNLNKSPIDCPTGTISMGAAIFPQNASDPDRLLRTADSALRAAKKTRGTFVLADPHENSDCASPQMPNSTGN